MDKKLADILVLLFLAWTFSTLHGSTGAILATSGRYPILWAALLIGWVISGLMFLICLLAAVSIFLRLHHHHHDP